MTNPPGPIEEKTYLGIEMVIEIPKERAEEIIQALLAVLWGDEHKDCCSLEKYCKNSSLKYLASVGCTDETTVLRWIAKD